MCFHSRQTKDAAQLEDRFNAKMDQLYLFKATDHYNGFDCPVTPVITNIEPKIIQPFHWGLIPSWAKDDTIRRRTLNARIERISTTPAYRSYTKNRCLVLSDGFYEWQWLDEKGKKKQKYLVTLPDNQLFAFAGLWSEWRDKIGNTHKTYTIVTTEANPFMAVIHNHTKRMPVILTPNQEHEWLEGAELEVEQNLPLEAIPLESKLPPLT